MNTTTTNTPLEMPCGHLNPLGAVAAMLALLKDKKNNKALYDKLVLENEKLKEENRKDTNCICNMSDAIDKLKEEIKKEKELGKISGWRNLEEETRLCKEIDNLKEENERIKDYNKKYSDSKFFKRECTIEELEDAISVLQRALISYFNLEGQSDLEDVLQFCRNEIDDLMPFNHSVDDDDE